MKTKLLPQIKYHVGTARGESKENYVNERKSLGGVGQENPLSEVACGDMPCMIFRRS